MGQETEGEGGGERGGRGRRGRERGEYWLPSLNQRALSSTQLLQTSIASLRK